MMGVLIFMSKFAATYFINKCLDGDDGDFSYELLDLHVMFDNFYEEQELVGEYTSTYDEVTYEILKEHPFGVYQVFVIGDITYSTDYYGESDVDVELDYWDVKELPEGYVEFELLGDDE
jgi:hypothetical protein